MVNGQKKCQNGTKMYDRPTDPARADMCECIFQAL